VHPQRRHQQLPAQTGIRSGFLRICWSASATTAGFVACSISLTRQGLGYSLLPDSSVLSCRGTTGAGPRALLQMCSEGSFANTSSSACHRRCASDCCHGRHPGPWP
jgi:hypothetical protein